MGDMRNIHSLSLPGLGVNFSPEQLKYLNVYFNKLEDVSNSVLNSYYETMIPSGGGPNLLGMDTPGSIEATIERLVQRLVTNVGILDSRFSSKYILSTGSTYEHYKINQPDEFDFMVRLDQLSSPRLDGQVENGTCIFEDDSQSIPQGFARIRLKKKGKEGEDWAEFTDKEGCLLPHKIRRRFCELMRWAVRSTPVDMANIDETRLPGGSGKVLDVGVLSDILQLDPSEHVYIRIGDPEKDIFPATRDFSVKVSEDGPAVRLDIVVPPSEEMQQEQKVSVDITLSIGQESWPTECDFPDRIPHHHVDAINCYRASKKGWHVVGTSPHETIQCQKRESLWRISHSTAEMELMTHYDHASIPAKVMRICKILTGVLRDQSAFKDVSCLFQPLIDNVGTTSVQLVSSYVLKTLFLFELEKFTDVEDWLESRVSLRVLSLISALVTALSNSHLRSFFFPKSNILLRKGIDINVSKTDADALLKLVKLIHTISQTREIQDVDGPLQVSQKLSKSIAFENDLASLWRNNLTKSVCNMEKDPIEYQFTERQFRYLNIVYGMVSDYSRKRYQQSGSLLRTILSTDRNFSCKFQGFFLKAGVETISRILSAFLKQIETTTASQNASNETSHSVLSKAILAEFEAYQGEDKWSISYVSKRIVGILKRILSEMDEQEEKVVEMVKDYLHKTYLSSLENGWFNEDIQQQLEPEDLKAVKTFARRTLNGGDAQAELIAAVERGEQWAIVLAEDLSVLGSIKFDFTPGPNLQVTYHVNKFQFDQRHRDSSQTEEEALLADLRDRFPAVACGCTGPTARTIHCKLQTDNPLRSVLDQTRRYGHHRVPGSLPNGLLRAGLRQQLNAVRTQQSL